MNNFDDKLRSSIIYCPETGSLSCAKTRKLKFNAKQKSGHLHGVFDGTYLKAHRVAWFISHNEWPDFIDHINGNPSDNRLCNLRAASRSDNNKNASIRKDNTSGVVGVYWNKQCKKWMAVINSDGKSKYLGMYNNKEAAIEARTTAEKYFGFCNNGRRTK
jgi:hypothetical protein